MAERKPLAGWRAVGVEDMFNVGPVDMGVTQHGYWYVDIESGLHGQVRPGAPRCIAAEDAARAMVAEMAAALGGRVVWEESEGSDG